jgi:hypothetical protein
MAVSWGHIDLTIIPRSVRILDSRNPIRNAPGSASFGRRPAGHVPAPQRQVRGVLMDAGLSRAMLIVRRPATSLRTKTKLEKTTPSGCRESRVLLRVQRCPRPYRPENALSIKSVREHFQVGWAARRWHLLVGVRWQRFQCRVAGFYFQRVSLPVQDADRVPIEPRFADARVYSFRTR